jgi:hypothetical protein
MAYPAHRRALLDFEDRQYILASANSGHTAQEILATLRFKHGGRVNLIAKDIYNIVQEHRLRELGGFTPIQWLMKVSWTLI